MNTSYYCYFICFILLFVAIYLSDKRRKVAILNAVIKNRKRERENNPMIELAKQFIGKDCLIYTMDSGLNSVSGVIKSVSENGMIIEGKDGALEAINLDYVTRIREYPRNKNGKKKSVVLD
ncbi:MAG: DUF6897 domain-containing protein [Eubacterium sp.]